MSAGRPFQVDNGYSILSPSCPARKAGRCVFAPPHNLPSCPARGTQT